jgi:hypothetical protein
MSAGWILNFSPMEEKRRLLGEMCTKFLTNGDLAAQQEEADLLTVRYEDLVSDSTFEPTLRRLYTFLDIELTDELLRASYDMKKVNFAPYSIKKNLTLSAADIERLALTIDPCIEMMRRFGYQSNLTSHATSVSNADTKISHPHLDQDTSLPSSNSNDALSAFQHPREATFVNKYPALNEHNRSRRGIPTRPPVPEKGPDFYSINKMLERLLSPQKNERIVSRLLANMVQGKFIISREESLSATWGQELQRRYTLLKYPHDISPKKRVAVELSIERSGSTMLLQMFNLINNSFILPEPYWNYSQVQKRPELDNAYPSIQSLADCSFALNKTTVSRVFWPYACKNVYWVRNNYSLSDNCTNGVIDAKLVNRRCRSAHINLIKVVRTTELVRQYGLDNAIPRHIKVFHLVRAPWKVFMGQAVLGWIKPPQDFKDDTVLSDHETMVYHLNRICWQMLLSRQVLQSRDKADQLTVRYEDFESPDQFDRTIKRLYSFLEIDMSVQLMEATRVAKDLRYAQFGHKATNYTVEAAEEAARRLPPCQDVIKLYQY